MTVSSKLNDPSLPDLPEWLSGMYPFRTRMLEVDGCRMSMVDEGPANAPVFVLVHGSPAWSFLFRDLIQKLRGQYRVVAPDHVGFGLSDKPADPGYHTLDRHIRNLTRIIEVLELRDLTLVMQDWGGPIGLGYAVLNPANVARMVLSSTWGGPLPNPAAVRLPLPIRIANRGKIGRALDTMFNLSMTATLSSRTHKPLSDWVMEGYNYPFPEARLKTAILEFSRLFFHPDAATTERLKAIEAGLKKISAPADIVWGTLDPLLTKLPAYLLRDSLRGAREPVFVPEAAHFVPEDEAAKFAELVLGGVRQQASNSATLFRILS
jgi:haloalkane dehalogenase